MNISTPSDGIANIFIADLLKISTDTVTQYGKTLTGIYISL